MTADASSKRPSGSSELVKFIVVVVVVLVIPGLILLYLGRDDFERAEVGDCLDTTARFFVSAETKVVDCASPEAKTRVVGVVKDKKHADWDNHGWQQLCSPWPEADRSVFFGPANSDEGDVLCLVKK